MTDQHSQIGFLKKYVFSTDHKVIGIQYAITSLVFLFIGFLLILLMRWQLAHPGQPVPVVGGLLQALLGEVANEGKISADLYNSFGAMHGTIMIFLGVVPLVFGAFANYLVPLQIGAIDMAFPKWNMLSYFSYLIGGVIMLISFFIPGGAAQAGWTSYPPLATIIPTNGQTYWLIAMVFLITSSLLGAINIITTVIQLRAPGMTWMRMPFFVWSQFVTAFLLLLAFPPLEAAAVLQLMDRLAGSSFYMPTGLIVSGQPMAHLSGGGSPLLWQHLFWFLGHPEVYVLILPAMGIVSEVIANNTRRPLWGYRPMVFSALSIGFLSMIVWAHHMYVTGMGVGISMFFQTTTTIISIPSVIILTCLMLSLWGGSIRFTVPMMFAIAFLPMFGIGGLTGLPLAYGAADLMLHDSYYVIGHFHYVVAPGTIFAVFAGIYYWFPKATGRRMSERLGHLHFWPSLVFMNLIFFPMMIQGLGGLGRRMSDGGATYAASNPANEEVVGALSQTIISLNELIMVGAFGLAVAQIPFVWNFFYSIWRGVAVTGDNPWQATTLEWQTPTPPPHGNFSKPMVVYRGPYDYSLRDDETDFEAQNQPVEAV